VNLAKIPFGRTNAPAHRLPLRVGAKNGFTLLEVLVVMFLIALVAGIAIPKFQGIFEVQLKSSIRKLIGSIKFCFNESIIKQSTIRLSFDIGAGTYRYSVLATNQGGTVGQFVELPSGIAVPVALPRGVYFKDVLTPRSVMKQEDGETFILFYPTGYAEKAVIHLADTKGREYTLLVKSMTGGVKLFEGYIDFAQFNQTQTSFGR
jgi:prepilin-type N-terminal cleavage/methylation domain-containing protein